VKIKSYVGLVYLLSVLQGCVALSFGEQSFPSIKNEGVATLNSSGVLELPDLTLSIRPQNAHVSVSVWGIIVPLLPLPGGITREEKTFRIYFQLESFKQGFSLEPTQVTIFVDHNEYEPQGFLRLGILEYIYAKFTDSPSVVSPGHVWHCDDFLLKSKKTRLRKLGTSILLEQKTCVVLEYPVITPSPIQEFTVNINGIKQHDSTIQVPPIHFHRKLKIIFESFMLQ
jgi:hypothetical protein